MRKFRWFSLTVVLAVVFSLFIGVAGAPSGAADDAVEAKPVRGQDVGGGKKLWVFVHPERPGKGPPGSTTPAYCTDGNQATAVPSFAGANPSGLAFNINRDSISIDKDAATQAITDSFGAWDSVSAETYFTVNNTGGASRPADDENNTVGWVSIVPKTVLAATWVWTDANNTITGTDVFFNSFHKWGVYTTCNAQSNYEIGSVGTHEIGHTVGLDHLSDPGAYATMYPTASKGEVRKRTLTDGDKAGYIDAGGY